MNLTALTEKVVELEDEMVTRIVERALDLGAAPMEIVNAVNDGLDKVGLLYERGEYSISDLMMAGVIFEDILNMEGMQFPASQQEEVFADTILLGTIEGDIHDIGKNIVKVLLENYGFDVIDLGKDVPPEAIVEKAVEENVTLVGLSALMTTTVVSMEETIKLLREKKPDCKVMVGGAVLNQDYADMIGADFYGKDAMQSVHYAQKFFGMVE